MQRFLPSILSLILLSFTGLSGCSQTPYSDKDGYSTDYPAVGQDISSLLQDVLNREGDPQMSKNATNGRVTFRVLSAPVMKAGDVVPSRDGTSSSVLFHGHVRMTLPNGQMLDCEDFENLNGTWQGGRFTRLYIDSFLGGAYVYGNPPDLTYLRPAFLQYLKYFIDTGGPSLRVYLSDGCSLQALFWELRGHDLIHQQYDFSTWLEANRLAMANANLMFDTSPAGSQAPSLASQAIPPPPTTPAKKVFDHYRLIPAPGISFAIPITDPTWMKYKGALFTPRFDETWAALAPTVSRIQLEQRLHDSMAASLAQAQRKAHAENGQYEGRIAQAAYVSQQPDATQADKDAYAQLARDAEAKLGATTAHLMALKILVEAIQADIDAQTQKK